MGCLVANAESLCKGVRSMYLKNLRGFGGSESTSNATNNFLSVLGIWICIFLKKQRSSILYVSIIHLLVKTS